MIAGLQQQKNAARLPAIFIGLVDYSRITIGLHFILNNILIK